ncbi:hypothetical protein Tco_0808973 [Tanacetum coccineum]
MYDYCHLEEIEVRRDDQKLYTFKEGDFKRLRLQDIKDMLLLFVQQKLTNLTIYEWYDLNVALRMYTRRIVIQRWVEDLQLGVKSYQKKLNLTKPDTYRSNLRNKTAYTSYSDPHGIIYVDQFKRKRLMRTDELHKFSNGYRQAALLEEVDAESRDVHWLKDIRERSQASGKDNMTLSYSVSTHFRDIPLDSVVVLMYEKRSKSEKRGKVPTEMELVLEQTQQVMRTASAAAKPCQGDSLEFYLITCSICTDQRGTMEILMVVAASTRQAKDKEKYEHVGLKVTRSQEGKELQDDDKRSCLVDDLKKLKITYKSKLKEQAQA